MSAKYISHPRYGEEPRFTGLDPTPDADDVFLHWNTNIITASQRRYLEKTFGDLALWWGDGSEAIRGTAITADVSRQVPATLQVTHYYDIKKMCRDCSSPFIFFAEEQKYWYEELQFPLEAGCVRCYPCRRKLQELQRIRSRYEELCSVDEKTPDDDAEQAECRLSLVEERVFHQRQLEQVRALLNRNPEHPKVEPIKARLAKLEASGG